MMGLDGTIAEALQSEEEDRQHRKNAMQAAQEEAEHEALLKELDDDDEVQCAQQVDHSDEVVDLSNEVVGTRRTTDVASSSSRFNSFNRFGLLVGLLPPPPPPPADGLRRQKHIE